MLIQNEIIATSSIDFSPMVRNNLSHHEVVEMERWKAGKSLNLLYATANTDVLNNNRLDNSQ